MMGSKQHVCAKTALVFENNVIPCQSPTIYSILRIKQQPLPIIQR